jgi:hypothetical protein
MSTAHSTLNAADRRELKQRGVSTSAIGRFKLVGIARINRIPDADWYEPCPKMRSRKHDKTHFRGCAMHDNCGERRRSAPLQSSLGADR